MTALVDAVAAWKPVDYSGSGDLLDASGNGHDATLQGTPTFAGGAYFDMDGTSDFFQVADHADLDFGINDSFSVVFVGYNTANPAQNEWALSKQLSFGVHAGYGLMLVSNGSGRFWIGDGTIGSSSAFPSSDDLPHNTIFDLGGLRDGTAGDDEVSWTHAGTEHDATTDATTASLANGNDLRLCGDVNAPASDNFTGRFYGAAIFGVLLTAAEVDSIADEITTAAAAVYPPFPRRQNTLVRM